MRTTVSIDDRLLELAKKRARERGTTLGNLVEESLHRYLAARHGGEGPQLPVFEAGTGMAPGIDPSSNASIYGASGEDMDIIDHVAR